MYIIKATPFRTYRYTIILRDTHAHIWDSSYKFYFHITENSAMTGFYFRSGRFFSMYNTKNFLLSQPTPLIRLPCHKSTALSKNTCVCVWSRKKMLTISSKNIQFWLAAKEFSVFILCVCDYVWVCVWMWMCFE
jgi:hypothetical protein